MVSPFRESFANASALKTTLPSDPSSDSCLRCRAPTSACGSDVPGESPFSFWGARRSVQRFPGHACLRGKQGCVGAGGEGSMNRAGVMSTSSL